MQIYAHGFMRVSGSLPCLMNSTGVSAVIDNGIGSYQFVLSEPIDELYTCLLGAVEDEGGEAVIANERNHYDRSPVDFLVELKDLNNNPVDSGLNFAIIEESHG